MNHPTTVDGLLVEWGDRLFYPANRIVRSPGAVLGSSLLRSRAQAIRARLHATVVRKAPQVMVKVTGGGRGMAAIAAHLRYISKNGRLPVEGDRGVERDGKEAVHELVDQWRHAGARIPEHSLRREAVNIMLSMPAGTPEIALYGAARDFARVELANHRYAMVLHLHQANPHVHIAVRAEGKDGRRLSPRKADLRRWREAFADRLRERGAEAEASPQISRGGHRRTERLWQHKERDKERNKAHDRGCDTAIGKVGEAVPKLTRARRDAARAWCEIANALASSLDPDDRRLAASIVQYARSLPGVRFIPAERQAQRKLPTMERGRAVGHPADAGPTRPGPRRGPEMER